MKQRIILKFSIVICVAFLIFGSQIAQAEIKVYDANNQYLGILVRSSWTAVTLFLPTLQIFTDFSLFSGTNIESLNKAAQYYESNDCSGTMYF